MTAQKDRKIAARASSHVDRKQTFSELFQKARSRDEFWKESAILEFTEEVARRMNEQKIKRSDLASKIEASPAYVTKVLRGNVNFTLGTMVKLARALDTVLRMHLAPVGSRTIWRDTVVNETSMVVTFDDGARTLALAGAFVPTSAEPSDEPTHVEAVVWDPNA